MCLMTVFDVFDDYVKNCFGILDIMLDVFDEFGALKSVGDRWLMKWCRE